MDLVLSDPRHNVQRESGGSRSDYDNLNTDDMWRFVSVCGQLINLQVTGTFSVQMFRSLKWIQVVQGGPDRKKGIQKVDFVSEVNNLVCVQDKTNSF